MAIAESNEQYKPDVLLRSALKESFFTPVQGGVDQNAITVDTNGTKQYMRSHSQRRPHTASGESMSKSTSVPAIVFGTSGLQALVERGKV